jgi:phage/plasmid-like protein (TIGR03299 family)
MAHGLTTTDQMFSVRQMPWHGLGVVLDEPPRTIDEALDKAGLGWRVRHGEVHYVQSPAWVDDHDVEHPAEVARAVGWKANIRTDTGELLGIVSDDYQLVDNREAFRFLDALIGSEMYFETAGSLWGGRRVWCLARVPEYVELGGDQAATYLYVANSHDGSMAVTAAVTPIRIVCANTLGMALRAADSAAERTFRFRHTGNLQTKFAEAREVLGMTINYSQQFKVLADKLALQRMSAGRFERDVLRPLFPVDGEMGKVAVANRERAVSEILAIFRGAGAAGDTTGNASGTKWAALNAVAEYADYGRRYTKRTSQVQRSFEDGRLKQHALDLVTSV